MEAPTSYTFAVNRIGETWIASSTKTYDDSPEEKSSQTHLTRFDALMDIERQVMRTISPGLPGT